MPEIRNVFNEYYPPPLAQENVSPIGEDAESICTIASHYHEFGSVKGLGCEPKLFLFFVFFRSLEQ